MKKTKFIIISVLVVISILVCSIIFINNKGNNETTIDKESDSSDFVLLSSGSFWMTFLFLNSSDFEVCSIVCSFSFKRFFTE